MVAIYAMDSMKGGIKGTFMDFAGGISSMIYDSGSKHPLCDPARAVIYWSGEDTRTGRGHNPWRAYQTVASQANHMTARLSKKHIRKYQCSLWRVGRGQRLKTPEQTADFLDEVGMCLLFACRDIPLPKIYDCAADDADWWAWKDLLQQGRQAYNGRLVRRKATLVSMKLLPAFYAAYLTAGGHAMHEEEYYWGKLGELANRIAQYLERHGPTPVDVLRRAIVSPGKEHTRRFHSALFELQSKFKIVSVGLEDKSWGIRVLDLFVNWVPSKVERRAENMSRDEAIQRISAAFLHTAGAVPEATLHRTFGWSCAETTRLVDSLVFAGTLAREHVRGDEQVWLVSPRLTGPV